MGAAIVPLVVNLLPEIPSIITLVTDVVKSVETFFAPNKKAGPSKLTAAQAMIADLLGIYAAAENVSPKVPNVNTSDMNAAITQIINGVVALNNALGVFQH